MKIYRYQVIHHAVKESCECMKCIIPLYEKPPIVVEKYSLNKNEVKDFVRNHMKSFISNIYNELECDFWEIEDILDLISDFSVCPKLIHISYDEINL